MFTWLRKILAPPVFEGDEDKTRTARALNTVLLTMGVTLVELPAASTVGLQADLAARATHSPDHHAHPRGGRYPRRPGNDSQ